MLLSFLIFISIAKCETIQTSITGKIYDATEIKQDANGVWLRCYQDECYPAIVDPDNIINLDEGRE